MASIDWRSLLTDILAFAVLIGAAFYAVFVLLSYVTYGVRPRPQVNLHDPADAAEKMAEWAGVSLVAVSVRTMTPVFAMLSEASAEVGDWFLRNHHPQTH